MKLIIRLFINNKKNIRLIERIFFFVFALFLFVLPTNIYSQSYYFEQYSIEEGVGSRVYSIIQDKDNFIWMGTLQGVSKFDGKRIENFNSEKDSLAKGPVKTIFQDSRGNLWLGHWDGGVTLYNGEIFKPIRNKSYDNTKDVLSIVEDINGQLWFATAGNGLYRLENPQEETKEFSFFNYRGGKIGDAVYDITLGRDSVLYFITQYGIKIYDRDSDQFQSYSPNNLRSHYFQYCIHEDQNNNIWIGTNNDGLIKCPKEGVGNCEYFDIIDGLETNIILKIFEDSKGNIWTINYDDRLTKGGITRINKDGFKAFNISNGLQDNIINCITEDKEGNILLGTYNHGLLIFKGEQFVTIFEEDLTENRGGLVNQQVYAVYQDNQGIYWFGTDRGITIYNPSASSLEERFRHINKTNSNIHEKIRFFDSDRDGNIWIGTEGGGVFTYSPKTKSIRKDEALNQRILYQDGIVKGMVVDKDNNLWVATNEGIGVHKIGENYSDRLTQRNGLSGNNISALYEDSKGNVWIGSQGTGITVWNHAENNFEIYKSLIDQTPKTFCEDQQGNIWVGTEQGLYVLSGDSIFMKFYENTGLLSNFITLTVADKLGNILIGTGKGINKYVPAEGKLYTYTKSSGFVGTEAKSNAGFVDNKGNVWFGTADGVTCYNPSFKIASEIEPTTRIVDMKIKGEPRKMKAKMGLNFKDNSITFDYVCISLSDPDAVRYQVMLEGLDTEWEPMTTENSKAYYKLPPGKYTFKVKAMNNMGSWNEHPATYSFSIRPPFYRTWWFILACVIIGAISIVSYIKIREQSLIREKRILEEKVQERTVELKDANDELAVKNKDITDSIRYAKRIQYAILPPELPKDIFVLFRPKDIVSGDFYWFYRENGKDFLAAVDCTGHGVPGAFMSLIGYSSLNKIIKEHKIEKPSEVLNRLNEEVTAAIHIHADAIVSDGMDLALVSYDHNKKLLEYSGAYNPLYLVRNGELIETKANRRPIGHSIGADKIFENHELEIQKGDTIYIFSDGYADQFGGPEGKKFRSKPMKAMLQEIAFKSVEEQLSIIEKSLDEWKGDYNQIDDILVIGRKF